MQESDLSFDCIDYDEQAYHGAEMEVPGKLQMGLNKCYILYARNGLIFRIPSVYY